MQTMSGIFVSANKQITRITGKYLSERKFMCHYCDPNGWKRKACNICGTTRVYISICVALENDDDYPYSQTDLCRECYGAYGIESAMDHNLECRT